jgi:hypothetical protein
MEGTFLRNGVKFKPGTRELATNPRDEPRLWFPGQTHIWRRGSFTVPIETTEEQVQDASDKYKKRMGEHLESKAGGSYRVLGFDGPMEDKSILTEAMTPPDRRAYVLWAKVRRRPVTLKVDVPDHMVPEFQAKGYKLV